MTVAGWTAGIADAFQTSTMLVSQTTAYVRSAFQTAPPLPEHGAAQ